MESKILVLALIVGTVSSAVWRGSLPEKPKELAHKEGCYIEELKDVIPFDTTVTPLGNCIRIHCSNDMVDYASCGVVFTNDPKCYKTDEDKSKPYPDCCPGFKCDMDNHLL